MAAIGISLGGDVIHPSFLRGKESNQICFFNPFSLNSNRARKIPQMSSSVSIASPNLSAFAPPKRGMALPDFKAKNAVFPGKKFDYWMQQSVPDIVKHLDESPLIVQIYSDIESGRTECKIEKARLEKWPTVKSEWKDEEPKSPNGLIFVKELGEENGLDHSSRDRVTKAWGLIVQQKGIMGCDSACYLLQTSRVYGGIGLGFCTYFCLIKVKNFMDSALEQFNDSWLLQR